MSDLFYEERPDEIISRVIATVVASPYNHIGQLVTKRTARMVQFFTALDPRTVERWRPQIWLACSCENQEWFDRRWPDMQVLAAEGWFIFVSLAPLIGPIMLPDDFLTLGSRTWVIVGGEHRVRNPRDMNPKWARALRDQCKAAGIPFFLKQMARDAPIPEGLRNLRQFPSMPPL
jgi:protein gp37